MRYSFQDLAPETAEVYGDIKILRLMLGETIALKIWKGKQSKPYMFYSYKSFERREEAIEAAKRSADARAKYRQDSKAASAENAAKAVELFQVGTLLVNSWGYDQTNVDFYQVIEVKGKTVVIKEICGRTVRNSDNGYMSSYVSPVKDSFKKDAKPITKRITGTSLRMDCGSLSITHELAKHYCSWYA